MLSEMSLFFSEMIPLNCICSITVAADSFISLIKALCWSEKLLTIGYKRFTDANKLPLIVIGKLITALAPLDNHNLSSSLKSWSFSKSGFS